MSQILCLFHSDMRLGRSMDGTQVVEDAAPDAKKMTI